VTPARSRLLTVDRPIDAPTEGASDAQSWCVVGNAAAGNVGDRQAVEDLRVLPEQENFVDGVRRS
jgi:hypothetical protein